MNKRDRIQETISKLYYYAEVFRVASEILNEIGAKEELIDSINKLEKDLNRLKVFLNKGDNDVK